MPDYFNPASFNPGTNFKPDGALGGAIWAEDRNRYNNLADIFQYNQGLDTQMNMGKLNDYNLDAPVRAATRQGTIANQNAIAQTAVPKALAETTSLQSKAKVAAGTVQAKLDEALSNAQKTVDANKWEQTQRDLQRAVTVVEQMKQDTGWDGKGTIPLKAQDYLKDLPPGIRTMALQGNPAQVLEALVKVSPKYLESVDTARIQGASANQSAQIAAGASRYGADVGAETARRGQDIVAQSKQLSMNGEQLWGQYARRAGIPPGQPGALTPLEKQTMDYLGQSTQALRSAGAQATSGVGASLIAPGANVPQMPPPPGTTPPVPGQVSPQQVMQAGWPYEPDKYTYVVGPDGRVGRIKIVPGVSQ